MPSRCKLCGGGRARCCEECRQRGVVAGFNQGYQAALDDAGIVLPPAGGRTIIRGTLQDIVQDSLQEEEGPDQG